MLGKKKKKSRIKEGSGTPICGVAGHKQTGTSREPFQVRMGKVLWPSIKKKRKEKKKKGCKKHSLPSI